MRSDVGLVEVDYRCVVDALAGVSSVTGAFARFGVRGFEAWQLVKDKRVKKYVFVPSGRVQWVVVGDGRDYLVYDVVAYCSCDDFYHAVMNGEAFACKHLIAQRLAVNLKMFDVVRENDENYGLRLEEWKI